MPGEQLERRRGRGAPRAEPVGAGRARVARSRKPGSSVDARRASRPRTSSRARPRAGRSATASAGRGVDRAARCAARRGRRPRRARRWRRSRGRAPPTCSKTSSVQRSGRPVTNTTGTPQRPRRASSTVAGAVGDACRRSAPGCRRGRWRPAGASAVTTSGSGRAITSSPSSLAPRSSVKPHFASTRTLALLVGLDAGADAYAGRVGLDEQRRERLGREAPAAGLLDQPVADLGLGHAVGGGLGRAEEADRAERGGAADDVPRRPGVAGLVDRGRVAVVVARVVAGASPGGCGRPGCRRPRRGSTAAA